jgi:hypothetical protein
VAIIPEMKSTYLHVLFVWLNISYKLIPIDLDVVLNMASDVFDIELTFSLTRLLFPENQDM